MGEVDIQGCKVIAERFFGVLGAWGLPGALHCHAAGYINALRWAMLLVKG